MVRPEPAEAPADPEPVAVQPEPAEPAAAPDPEPVAVQPEPAEPAEGPPTQFYDVAYDAGRDTDWAPVEGTSPEPEFELEAVYEPHPEPVAAPTSSPADEVEVIDVISPPRRPLARSGSR